MTDAVRAPTPPPARTTSILPAAAILVIAIVTLASFALVDAITTGSTTSTTLPVMLGTLPVGHGIFTNAVQGGEPPADIASGLLAPAGTRFVSTVVTGGGGGTGDYDLEYRLRVDAPRSRLLGFYHSDLGALGWTQFSVSSSGATVELLFQKSGSDGFFWDLGVKATATSRTETTYTYRIFQYDPDQ